MVRIFDVLGESEPETQMRTSIVLKVSCSITISLTYFGITFRLVIYFFYKRQNAVFILESLITGQFN